LQQTSDGRLQERDSVHLSQFLFDQPKTDKLKEVLSPAHGNSPSTTAATSTTTTDTTTTSSTTSSSVITPTIHVNPTITNEVAPVTPSLSELKSGSESENNKRNENTSILKK
jgi:hypothetical protein